MIGHSVVMPRSESYIEAGVCVGVSAGVQFSFYFPVCAVLVLVIEPLFPALNCNLVTASVSLSIAT